MGKALRAGLARVLSFARLAVLRAPAPAPRARREAKEATPRAPGAASPPKSQRAPAKAPTPRQHSRTARSREPEAEGQHRERARCAAIIQAPEARRNHELAVQLATDTDLTAAQAIAVLSKAQPARMALHPERADRNPRIAAAGDPARSPAQAAAARMDRAIADANPSARQPAGAQE
ncbi:hypothetical protein HHL11_07080 [Ramlibacter sp. G-1-2-2]|uniref:Uncharacterized protein n=1 Tax=Ramlibacter agri TaxID=2728837 RepID=A0A848GY49_9BURK|nr:hypothetical protein [Ramlibacter agri]NML43505.1 hypothetical protein [Ramlibacter agri]